MQRCSSGLAASSSGRGTSSLTTMQQRPAPHRLRYKMAQPGPVTPHRPVSQHQRTGGSSRYQSSATGNDNTMAQEAERFARDAQRRATEFAVEQQLQAKANKVIVEAKAQVANAFQSAKVGTHCVDLLSANPGYGSLFSQLRHDNSASGILHGTTAWKRSSCYAAGWRLKWTTPQQTIHVTYLHGTLEVHASRQSSTDIQCCGWP